MNESLRITNNATIVKMQSKDRAQWGQNSPGERLQSCLEASAEVETSK